MFSIIADNAHVVNRVLTEYDASSHQGAYYALNPSSGHKKIAARSVPNARGSYLIAKQGRFKTRLFFLQGDLREMSFKTLFRKDGKNILRYPVHSRVARVRPHSRLPVLFVA